MTRAEAEICTGLLQAACPLAVESDGRINYGFIAADTSLTPVEKLNFALIAQEIDKVRELVVTQTDTGV